ncbi:reverse transcriptase domain-containing protein [Tanacetum coccineum]
MSTLKALVEQHNERSSLQIAPIRLSFGDEGQGDKGKGKEIKQGDEDLQKPYKEVLKSPFTRRIVEFSSPMFMCNSKFPELASRFSDQVSGIVTEMMRRVDEFIKSEEAYKSTKLPKGEHPEKGQGSSYRGKRLPRIIISRMFPLEHPELPPCPPPLDKGNTKKENLDRYCDYHEEKGHYTSDCYQLKKQLEATLESGKLGHLVKDVRQKGNTRARQPGNNSHQGKIINMIRMRGNSQKPDDVSDEPLIVEADVEGYLVQRVFVDQGAVVQEKLLVVTGNQVSFNSNPDGIEDYDEVHASKSVVSLQHHLKTYLNEGALGNLVHNSCNDEVVPKEKTDKEVLKDEKKLSEEDILVNPLPRSRALSATIRDTIFSRMLKKSKAVVKEVEVRVKAGIVRPVLYPTWISNLVLVKKVDDMWRMCIDFKNVNSTCPKDYYPLPEIDMKIQSMSFGLKNIGATYQRLVDSAFQTQMGQNLEVYVDDMVIKSKTEQEMIMDIVETFDNLQKVNMKLNPKKCSFGVKEGNFLGYMVTSKGIRANPKKTKAVADMQSPKTLKEMQSLSGKLAMLNQFLSRSAERALPFFKTLKNVTKENKDD